MTTLIKFTNSVRTRRCDAHCYDAKGDTCDCICNGANHGKGLIDAANQTNTIAREIIRQCEEHEIHTYDWWRVDIHARGQLTLF